MDSDGAVSHLFLTKHMQNRDNFVLFVNNKYTKIFFFLVLLTQDLKNWNGEGDSNCFTMCLRILIVFIFVFAAIGSHLSSPKQPHTLIQKGWPSSFSVHARDAITFV